MGGSVRDLDLGFKELAKQLAKLAGTPVSVLVGVHGEKDSEMVVIAASNEFGTADGHVPERSYLRSTVDEQPDAVLDDLQRAVDRTLAGRNIDQMLGLIGEKWVGKVKMKIRTLDEPANAPSTIAAKGADNPLIDQGRLRNSITWTLHKGDTKPLGGA